MKRVVLLAMMVVALPMGSQARAEEHTVTLAVENMICSLCPVMVRKALQGVDGVQEVTVSLEEKKAVITFDDDRTDIAALVTATTNAGFPSTVVNKDERYDD